MANTIVNGKNIERGASRSTVRKKIIMSSRNLLILKEKLDLGNYLAGWSQNQLTQRIWDNVVEEVVDLKFPIYVH